MKIVAPVFDRHQEGFFCQGAQVFRQSLGHFGSRLGRKSAPKDGEPAQRGARLRVEQVPRIIEDGPQTALAFRHILHPGRQRVQAAGDILSDLGCRPVLDLGGCQLDP